LTLDPAIRHTVVHHSSTSTYIPNFIEIEGTFCGRTDVRMDGHFSPSNIIRSTFGSRPKKYAHNNFLYTITSTEHSENCTYLQQQLSNPAGSRWGSSQSSETFHPLDWLLCHA